MFKKIARRRQLRAVRLANIVRPDTSFSDLLGFQRDGFTQAVFVKNPIADEECTQFNGNIYEISELLKLDNPIFRISHPNCTCKFMPYGQGTKPTTLTAPEAPAQTATPPATLIQKPEVPPMTIKPAPKQTV